MSGLLRTEVRVLTSLALPLMLSRVGQMAMGVADTVMAGSLGNQAVAALGLGHTWALFPTIFAMGILVGLDPHVSQGVGAEDRISVGRAFAAGRALAMVLSIPAMILIVAGPAALIAAGQPANLMPDIRSYLWIYMLGLPAHLLFEMYSIYLAGHGDTRPFALITIVANVFNLIGNFAFLNGWGPIPQMGVAGLAASTVIMRYASLVCVIFLLHFTRRARWIDRSARAEPAVMLAIVGTGWSIGVQYTLEYAGFGIATLIVGRLGEAPLAGHQVALNVASIPFTAAMGLAEAASIRVGYAVGRGDVEGARRAGHAGWVIGLAIASVSAIAMYFGRYAIADAYLSPGPALETAAALLAIAGIFQLADATQVIGFGVLRGLGDVRVPVLFNALAYYVIGLPLGGYVTLYMIRDPAAVWWGLTGALATVATLLVIRFHAQLRRGVRRLNEPAVSGV